MTGPEATVQTQTPWSVDRAAVWSLAPDYVQNLGNTNTKTGENASEFWRVNKLVTLPLGEQRKEEKKKKKNGCLVNQSGRDLIRSINPLERNFPPGLLNGW